MQAHHNVDSAQTAKAKAENQKVLGMLEAALKREEDQKPPKVYDAPACKVAADNWRAVEGDHPDDALSAEKLARRKEEAEKEAAYQEAAKQKVRGQAQAAQAASGAVASVKTAEGAVEVAIIGASESAGSAGGAVAAADSDATASTLDPSPTTPLVEKVSTTCTAVADCYHTMLRSAQQEDLASALNAAQQIDALAKPLRGDRKTARDANKAGLDALQNKSVDQAIAFFMQGAKADPGDVEVLGNLAYAYGQAGEYQDAESAAISALALNPRRTSIWVPVAVTLAQENRPGDALAAMWLAFQFSADKQKTLMFIDARIAASSDPRTENMYEQSKAWFTENKRPSFN